jgi:Protein of unknown function (DUF998)
VTRTSADRRPARRRWLRAAAVAGIVGSLAQNAWVFESLVTPRASYLDSYVSDLGAKTQPTWWFWTAANEVAGIGTIVFAVAVIPLWSRFERRARTAVAGALLFLASGVGTIADGVLRLPCPERLSPGCEARLEAGLGGWVYTAHEVESSFTSVVAVAGIVLIAWALRADGRWRSAARWMWWLMPAFLAFNLLTGLDALLGIGWPGLWMRLLLVATAGISLPPMVRLWQLATEEAERSVWQLGREPLEHPGGVERAS